MDTRRKQAKQKKRGRVLRDRTRRRDESRRTSELLLDAELLADGRDWPGVERALLKALGVRPGHQEARERLVQAYAMMGRPADVLAEFERLEESPRWPYIMFLAADAALALNRLEQASALAARFLADTRGLGHPVLDETRKQARQLDKRAKSLLASARRAERAPRAAERRPAQLDVALGTEPAASPHAFTPADAPPPGLVPADSETRPSGHAPLPAFPDVVAPVAPPTFEIVDLPAATLDLPPVSLADMRLTCRYAALRLERGFDQLLALADADVEHLWYQIETVRRTLRDFRGRVLLADEVGLGKTIEACLVLKEYWKRGLVRRALVLTPPSLVSQWVDELRRRVHLDAVTPDSGRYASAPDAFWAAHPLVVASLALARQAANRDRLATLDYDLVIVDEAHDLKSRSSAAWQLVNSLRKRFLLLLSATPVGNDLGELYNLILLLRPGLLSTEARFRREYGRANALADPTRREKLRALLREVMVRNTRAHIDLKLPRRLAATTRVTPGPAEARLLDDLDAFVRTQYHAADRAQRWALTMLQMQAGSSPRALAGGLARYGHGDGEALDALRRRASAIGRSAKTDALIALLARSPEKKIVFTRFLATLEDLHTALEQEGCRVALYHGSLTQAQKDHAVADFEHHADVLLASEVGGEGRNLQFCRTVVNFDLPWNPMAIEQRVGRVHRIGQTREVYVFNFCLAGSVEEYVLRVLHDKINLFELVAGEMEMILGEFGEDVDFGTIVMDLWAASASPAERDHAFEQFAAELAGARARYDARGAVDRAIFREDYEV